MKIYYLIMKKITCQKANIAVTLKGITYT